MRSVGAHTLCDGGEREREVSPLQPLEVVAHERGRDLRSAEALVRYAMNRPALPAHAGVQCLDESDSHSHTPLAHHVTFLSRSELQVHPPHCQPRLVGCCGLPVCAARALPVCAARASVGRWHIGVSNVRVWVSYRAFFEAVHVHAQ